MSVVELIEDLASRGVELWLDGDVLRFRAPSGTLSGAEREELASRRQQVLEALRARQEELPAIPRGVALTADPAKRHEPFPLTDIQQAYWLGQTSTYELGGVSAHLYVEYELPELDPRRLTLAWRRILDRHEMLRCELLPDGRQRIRESLPGFAVPVVDLRRLPAEAAATCWEGLRRRMAAEGPRLDRVPLFEARLGWLPEGRQRLAVSISLLICDALSTMVLIRELLATYADLDARLTPLEVSYRDCVLALAGERQTEGYRASLAYWRERVRSLPLAPELPVARDVSQLSGARFYRLSRRLEPGRWRRFQAAARGHGITPSAALCAAYAEVLARFSKSPRFALNLLFFNRPPLHPQVVDLVGNFSSTILLEVDTTAAASFAARARRLQEQLWRDIEHSRVTGVEVVRELHRVRPADRRAVWPVVFASTLDLMQRGPATAADDAWARALIHGALQTPQVWLDHQVSEQAGALSFNWDSVEGLFPPGLVDAMFEAYERLLEALIDRPESWTERPPELLPAAQLEARRRANSTAAAPPVGLLHEPFWQQVARAPAAPAVITPERTLSYREVAARAHALALRLRHRGVRVDELVAVVMVKGWEQVVACLAILEAGAAYLPIDAELPPERLAHLLARGEARFALTQPGPARRLTWPAGLEVLAVEPEPPPDDAPCEPLPPTQGPRDLAYVIFTSGSTGQPKGVMIDHRGALNTVADVNRRFGVTARDRTLALSELNFDLSVYDLFGLLGAGGAVVMPDPGLRREPEHWRQLIDRAGVTLWNTVPALAEMLIDHLTGREVHGAESLRLFLLSGDWIPVTLPDRLRSTLPGTRVVSLGGATEASIWSILYPIGEVEPGWPSIPYGKPMLNQTFHVLDEAFRPCPVWVPGRLFIGGIGLARGYWRDPERSDLSFVRHPETGESLYRTGDLGRYLPDGNLEFLGREDFQVKIQGFRIELGEIEANLLQHPAVVSAVVIAAGDRATGRRLVAYVVERPERSASPEELRAHLAGKLPDYMVPGVFVSLAALPLSANGKVDRAALPAPSALAAVAAARTEPRDPTEHELVGLWRELLGVEQVGVQADFFTLGGNSLLAVRLMGSIRQRWGVELPLGLLLEAATVEQLAARLGDAAGRPEQEPCVAIRPEGDRPPFFCVHPVGGNVLCYAALARSLPAGQPFYGLQSPPPEAGEVADLEELAAGYLRAVRRVQAGGPYRLGGWSMGGVVAFEMARQLEAAGEVVELLALIDALPPGTDPAEPRDEAAFTARFASDLAGLGGGPPAPGGADLARLYPTFRRNYGLLLAYRPRAVVAAPTLVVAGTAGTGRRSARLWRPWLAAEPEEALLVADHYSLLTPPCLDELAARLEQRLSAPEGTWAAEAKELLCQPSPT